MTNGVHVPKIYLVAMKFLGFSGSLKQDMYMYIYIYHLIFHGINRRVVFTSAAQNKIPSFTPSGSFSVQQSSDGTPQMVVEVSKGNGTPKNFREIVWLVKYDEPFGLTFHWIPIFQRIII